MVLRPSTAEEQGYDGEPLDLDSDFIEPLERGFTIHGYSSATGVRVIKILEQRDYSDGHPMLGYGEAGDTDEAMRRARDTYRRRAAEGLVYMDARQYPEGLCGLSTGGTVEDTLDAIVWGGDFRLYKDGAEFVAWSRYGRYGRPSLEGRGASPSVAVGGLVDAWQKT